MREYKFRAWDMERQLMLNIFDSEKLEDWFLPNWKKHYKVMQYTGLKDKNDVEIYEGDIINISASQPGEEKYEGSGIVTLMEGAWVIDTGTGAIFLWSETFIKEITGNIYENPEVLKEGGLDEDKR